MWSGHDFIFTCANLEGKQKALMDVTQNQCLNQSLVMTTSAPDHVHLGTAVAVLSRGTDWSVIVITDQQCSDQTVLNTVYCKAYQIL